MPVERVAALYDVHGNLPALEAVLDDVRRAAVDLVVVGGDVMPGPMPRECLQRLLALDVPVRFLMGNGDREVLASRAGGDSAAVPERFRENIRWCARQLGDADAAEVAGWPATIRTDVAGVGRVLFCHATPRSDTDVFTRLTPDAALAPVLGGIGADVVVCGHTHMQFERTVGDVRIVNAGSVGMPFAAPGAYWLELAGQATLRHTPYDLPAAASRIRATAYPQAEEFAAHNVLAPPAEEAMVAAFTRSGLA